GGRGAGGRRRPRPAELRPGGPAAARPREPGVGRSDGASRTARLPRADGRRMTTPPDCLRNTPTTRRGAPPVSSGLPLQGNLRAGQTEGGCGRTRLAQWPTTGPGLSASRTADHAVLVLLLVQPHAA